MGASKLPGLTDFAEFSEDFVAEFHRRTIRQDMGGCRLEPAFVLLCDSVRSL
jgi:hypothetical protein